VTLPSDPQAAVVARLPRAAALGLVAPPTATSVPVADLADPVVTAELVAARTPGAVEPRVAATVWWYSASAVLLTPSLAGLVTGMPLSARPTDLSVSFRPGGLPVAATSSARSADLGPELRELLTTVIGAVAEVGGMRERPLWAIATDALAGQLLALGRAIGDVPAVTRLAAPIAAAVGAPLPVPRYVDVAGTRFVRRASCCLVYRLPGGPLCTSCPRRPPAERTLLLERAATRF
jgi:ferric iron reductase protein FhuF